MNNATTTTTTTNRRKALVLAHQLMRHEALTFGEAQIKAWAQIKAQDCTLLRFIKVDRKTGKETIASRVVTQNWQEFYQVKGTGRPTKPGQVLFADIARIATGQKNVIISTYTDRIIEQAA